MNAERLHAIAAATLSDLEATDSVNIIQRREGRERAQ